MQIKPGTTLQNGRYKIEKVLGQGGFGITYLATKKISFEGPIGQIETEIQLAIKEFFMKDICNRENGTNAVSIPSVGSRSLAERFKQKFIKEARNISKLKHPDIIKVVDVFEENDTAYYVMEYHGNGSLNRWVRENGPMPEDKATKYVLQVADALKYIHEHQMNHLDVKPDNILINNKGEAVLIDFGLSKCYDSEGEQTSTTPVGVSVGYAPLEQSKVGGVGTFSPATDIYSLGATFYKLVTARTPPEASEVLDDGLPDMPSHITSRVKNTIIQAMEPRRKKRPQTIDEFLALLGTEAVAASEAENSENTELAADLPCNVDSEETALVDPLDTRFREINEYLLGLGVRSLKPTSAVDLGLSVMWANCNIGSVSPGDKGGLYGWADPTGAVLVEGFYLQDKQVPIDIANTEYDIVTKNLGSDWSLPNIEQWKELIGMCKWEWISGSLVKGYLVTGITGEKIFLPMAGRRYGENDVRFADDYGYYYSSERSADDEHLAKYCFLHKDEQRTDGIFAYYIGRSVRGVRRIDQED